MGTDEPDIETECRYHRCQQRHSSEQLCCPEYVAEAMAQACEERQLHAIHVNVCTLGSDASLRQHVRRL